jgi:ubiquitin-conjugating enzyme E2 Q
MTIAGQIPVHHRVEDTSLYPTVKLSDVGVTQKSSATANLPTATIIPATPATTPPPPMLIPATMAKYDQMFDDMDEVGKAESIVMLLETLPTIKELRSYLVHQGRSAEPSLRTWKERVSPAALGILRWIIASNRSCIVQVDVCPGQTEVEVAKAKIRLDQKCSNVNEHYVQFRFAQGAPDKEQRFLNALKEQQANLNAKYPTMFAWHGSPLQNWHSIIRHGLDFKETLHGRAYGHGVYHAQDQNISVGYAQHGVVSPSFCTFHLSCTNAHSILDKKYLKDQMLTSFNSLIGQAPTSQSPQL